MKHRIDPKIDCVFKALLGSEENHNLLVHFLNAILTSDLSAPITEAEILNPYNDKEFLDDKLSVVDAKPRKTRGGLTKPIVCSKERDTYLTKFSIHAHPSSACP